MKALLLSFVLSTSASASELLSVPGLAQLAAEKAKEAQAMFNRVYGEVVSNQSVIAPPSGATLSPRAWQVICWNIMWLATDEANTFLRK